MSRSRKIFELIQPQVPGTVLCGHFLIIKPTDYIARGFFLDTTSHKDHMTLWRVVMPLHRPCEHFGFNYSKAIPGERAGLVHIDKKAYEQSAASVFEKIREHVGPLRQLRGPRDFLRYISWMSGNRMLPVRTDFGLTHYMVGNMQEAIRIFRRLDVDVSEYGEATQQQCKPLFRQVLDLLENDPSRLRCSHRVLARPEC